MTNALPVVDISAFLKQSSLQEKQKTAKSLHDACVQFGFLYLKGHGLTIEEMAEIRKLSKEFFDLSEEEKQAISISNNDLARGYQKLGQNITLYAQDWHEGVDLYAPVDDNHIIKQRGLKTLAGKNPDPQRPANFTKIVDEYVVKMKRIGMATMSAMAMGLGLEERFFDKYMENSFWVMRLIGYPPLKKVDNVGISCGEHTDYGCLTILNTDDTTGALQVLAKSGEWITADPIPGHFVINIGDMVNNWTNDMYKSTLHRVIHTKESYRVSVPFFFEPNFDAVIEPLPICVEQTGGKPKYTPVMYGDHLLGKVTNNFDVSDGK
ncbi:hypothetical protein HDV01_006943 [Terramyces sp. JEL0728]|nr:hypothetical protein HDV01_006943 [Terramyces sp. JEL0728]